MKPVTGDKDSAFSIMAMDILNNVLSRADNPGELGKYLAEEICCLTGARCVLLIKCLGTPAAAEHQVVSVSPLRRRDWVESQDGKRLYEAACRVTAAQLWHGEELPEVAGILRQEGFELSMVFPLYAGEFRVGAMLVLGLPDEEHINSVLSLLNNLSAIVALVLRNAILFEKQEYIIQERTTELRGNNVKLAAELIARKKAEEERLAHLRFFENLDKINRAIQGASDLEHMMSDVLGAALSIFDCDRAWLFYPCDPDAPSFRVPMEISRPKYPGAGVLDVDIPMFPDMARDLQKAMASEGPVICVAGTENPINKISAEQFGVQSMMYIALYPKLNKPWVFGLHQCSYPRIWTDEEKKLFKEISWRLADALTGLLLLRNLKESEERYHAIIDISPIPYALNDDRQNITFLNKSFVQTFGYTLEEIPTLADWRLRAYPDKQYRQWVSSTWQAHIEKAKRDRTSFEPVELTVRCKNGVNRNVVATAVSLTDSFAGEHLVILYDITERKRAEEQVLKLNRIYAVLSNINQAIVRIHETGELFNEACRIAIEYGKFRMVWIGMVNSQTGKVDVAASNGVSGDYLQNINIDLNDENRSSGPVGIAVKTGKHKISNNISQDNSMIPWRDNAMKYDYKSVAAFPLIVLDKVVGAFTIYSNETDFFDEGDIKLLDEMAKDISFALEFIENETKRKQAEEKIVQSLREKETLIRELYHRTKNTMQIIGGIIILQADEYPDNIELQRVVKNVEDKIQAISLVHRMLYKSQDLSQISVKEYLQKLSALIMQSFGASADRISLVTEIDDRHFLLDTAIPFGLIINELITNSMKYAFPDNRKGIISISITTEKSKSIILHYSDNGVGVADGFDFRAQNTLGLKLIYGISEMQLMGKVTMQNNNGVSCSIEFSDKLYKARV